MDAGRDGTPALLLSETQRPENDTQNFYQVCAHFTFDQEDFSEYNHLSCYIKPVCESCDFAQLNIGLYNGKEHPIPDKYWLEGIHMNSLVNGEWNHVIWEFQDLHRDCVEEIIFNRFVNFHDHYEREILSKVAYYIEEVTLEYVEYPDHAKGWIAPYDVVNYSTMGYMPKGKKTAVTTVTEGIFELLDESDRTVLTGDIQTVTNPRGKFGVIDFSDIHMEGNYRIKVKNITMKPFPISDDILEDTFWLTLNGIFIHRCGYPLTGICGGSDLKNSEGRFI